MMLASPVDIRFDNGNSCSVFESKMVEADVDLGEVIKGLELVAAVVGYIDVDIYVCYRYKKEILGVGFERASAMTICETMTEGQEFELVILGFYVAAADVGNISALILHC